MKLKWQDTEIGFQGGILDMSKAVVKVRLRHQKGVKGHLNQWRDVSQSTFAIQGMAHLDFGAIIMTYAMRSGQVKGTLEEICAAAVKTKDRKVKWLPPNDLCMHRYGATRQRQSIKNAQTEGATESNHSIIDNY